MFLNISAIKVSRCKTQFRKKCTFLFRIDPEMVFQSDDIRNLAARKKRSIVSNRIIWCLKNSGSCFFFFTASMNLYLHVTSSYYDARYSDKILREISWFFVINFTDYVRCANLTILGTALKFSSGEK